MNKKSFWDNLPRPFLALAPMEDVTDTVFRQMVVRCGRPDVMFTEFTNVNGLCSVGVDMVGKRLKYSESERPIVAQIWGTEPEMFFQAAKYVRGLGFDGIDINFGCPIRDIVKSGACSAMIGKNKLVAEIIQATIEGSEGLPISVKTRIGIKNIVTEEWTGFLMSQKIAAVTIHARTAQEMSMVPAHWEEIGRAVQLRDQMGSRMLIIGNGDVKSTDEAREKYRLYGVDGVMIGRGVLENPWLFKEAEGKDREERLTMFLEHIRLWRRTWENSNNFGVLKKFAKAYIREFEGSAELRTKVMEKNSAEEIERAIRGLLA